MKTITAIIFCMLMASSPVIAEETLTKQKRADIELLLQKTGALKIGQQMANAFVQQMTLAVKNARPDIPENMFQIIREEVNAILSEGIKGDGGLFELMVQLNHKHYTHEDIKGLLAFYNSELGEKVIRITPVLSQEGMTLGQAWGRALAPKIQQRILKRFKEKGFDLVA